MASTFKQVTTQTLILAAMALALALFSVNGSEMDREERGEDEAGGGAKLDEWLYQQRAYPLETIPVAAGEKMLEQVERLEAESAALMQMTGNGTPPPVWAPIGPEPIQNGQTFGFPRNNVSGRISALAVDPRYDGVSNRTIYLGGAQGGLWRTDDNGETWRPLTDDQPSQAIGAIAIDPREPETIYVGLGEGSRCALCYYGSGLLKSTDGGRNWRLITGPVSQTPPNQPVFSNAAFTRIAIDPVTTSTIYATTTFGYTSHATSSGQQVTIGQVGLWRSTDGGETWANLDPGGTNGGFSAHDVAVDPLNPNIVYVGMRTIGIFRSLSKGAPGSWQLLSKGLPDIGNNPSGTSGPSTSPYRRVALAVGPPVAPSTASTLYAAFAASNDDLLGIYRSVDNGENWTVVNSPQRLGQTNYNLDIAVDPGNGNILYYGTSANTAFSGGTLWRTADGGQTWKDISIGQTGGGLHADTHRIAISRINPSMLVTGNDGGVWRTENARAETFNWRQLNDTLNLSQFVSLALHPSNPGRLYGGTQDNGTNMYVGSLTWDHVADGDGGYVLVDQADPRVVYHTYFNVNNSRDRAQIGPRVSTSSGSFGTWAQRGCFGCTTATAGNFNPADRVAFYAPMAQNTAFTGPSGNVVYFGTYRLYRTANRGQSWTGLGASTDGFGADLTKVSGGTGVITAIAASPVLNQTTTPPGETVWVGTSDGLVQVSTNAGGGATATFTNVTKSPLPNRFVSEIAVDPNNAQHAVVVYSGFDTNTPGTPGHVFVTTNLGMTWTNISGNLPDVPVTSVTINPSNPNQIFIGTDLGVFQTIDGGQTWTRPGLGMPMIATFAVRYHAATGTLFAATHGRGIYRLANPLAAANVSAASFQSNAPLSAESIASVFGNDLAISTEAATQAPLPTRLAGTRVAVRDSRGAIRYAPLFFVSPRQINYLVPAGTAPGEAAVIVTNNLGTASYGTIVVQANGPGLFSANSSGTGVAAAYVLRERPDGSLETIQIINFDSGQNRFVAAPLDLGNSTAPLYLVLFGTGMRQIANLASVRATVGGVTCEVLYAGVQPVFTGVDQVNLRLPATISSLSGRGEVPIQLTVDGLTANLVTMSVK